MNILPKPSVRKRRFFKRMAGYVTEPFVRRGRVTMGRDQHVQIGGHELVLPPSHKLGYYLRRDPRYDVYAAHVLENLAADRESVSIIDVGANVGDTATIALGAAPNIVVLSVEGNPGFVSYARRNLASFGERSRIVERFVGPITGSSGSYGNDGSTGRFVPTPEDSEAVSVQWVTPRQLLESAPDAEMTIWKSDTDGFDIHLLVEYWDVIDKGCDVIWFEYDPFETLGDVDDVARCRQLLAQSGRGLFVYDNLGNRMLSVAPGGDVERTLADLTAWLGEQRESHMEVAYFDLWAVRSDAWFETPLPPVKVRHT